MNDTPRFGTAGLADSYTVKKFDPAAIAAYTAGFGLTAFEYQCGRGVRLAHDKAAALGAACAERNIALSVHAPYYISMSSLEEDKRLHSIDYLLQSCALVKALGGRRVIFHSGSCGKQSREAALEKALDTMKRAVKACDEAGYGDCILCPETMGKVNPTGHTGRGAGAVRRGQPHHPLHRLRAPVRPQLRHTVCRGHCRRGLRRPARHTG